MTSSTIARLGGLAAAAALTACADPTSPTTRADAPVPSAATAAAVSHPSAMPASVQWNGVARGLVLKVKSNAFVATRLYALVSIAQRDAVASADRLTTRHRRVSRRAAAAAASAAVLRAVYPAEGAALDSMVAAQVATAGWVERGSDAAAGVLAGRAAGEAVVAHAASDRFFAPFTGSVPTGPGKWFSSMTPAAPPGGATIGAARPWLLRSTGQFRPAPPPAFGSAAFLAGLAEVRRISDTRTVAQDSIAKFWAMGAGTVTPAGHWNEVASALIVERRLDERRAANVLALVNMIGVDALIASHEAKYTYWLLRPTQADPAITLSIGLPNFPSYASNHAAISAAMTEALSAAFPRETRRLRAAAEMAAMSRVYGGIHYRFDGEAGLALGRRVGRWGVARAGRAHGVSAWGRLLH